MTNAFYNHGTFPATGSSGSSSAMRAELDLIAAGFDLLPTLSGNAGKFVLVNSGASALTVSSALSETGGNVTVAGGLAVTGTVSGVGFSSYLASPPAIGGTAAAAGSFTTLSASSTVSGAGFSAYLASPPAIGGTAAAAGSFTTLALSSTATLNAGTANQVQYLNGSKQLAGSANLTFDGTTLTAAGLSGPHNGTVGATTPSTGSFTTVAVSSTLTLSAGTANQIGYLNASKQLVGSGNMTFNGFWIQLGGGVVGSQNAGVVANGSTTAAFRMVNASTGNTATDGVDIELNVLDLNIINREAGNITLHTSGTEQVRLDASGNLGIGTSSPSAKLNVVGSADVSAILETTGTSHAASLIARSGNGTTSGLYAYARFVNNDTNAQDWRIGTYGNNNLSIVNAKTATVPVVLDTSGNLGIGTSSPTVRLDVGYVGGSVALRVSRDANNRLDFYQGSGVSYIDSSPVGGQLAFATAGTEKMRLDASGNLGLGVTPGTWGASYRAIEFPGISIANLNGGTNQQAQYLLNARDAGTGTWVYKVTGSAAAMFRQTAGAYEWHTAPSGTAGNAITFTQAMTLDASGRLMVGNTSAQGPGVTATNAFYSLSSDAATVGSLATFTGYTTVASYKANGAYLRFDTADTGGTVSERMRLDSGGNLLVGTTSAIVGVAVGMRLVDTGSRMELGSAQSTNAYIGYSMYSTGAAAYRFYVGFGGTIFATSTTITAISDQRLKENIRDLDDGLGTVMALKPRKFDWKAGKGKDIKGDRGFIAQEFEQVLPDLIEEWKDPAPEGEEPYKAINANLIPTLVKAIQEQQALITKLTDRIAALEARCV